MKPLVLTSMCAELAKLAGVGSRAASLVTGSKAKTLGNAATHYADEASRLGRVADAGGMWKQLNDPRFNKRVRDSAGRAGRAAGKLKELHKSERKAVNLTRAGLGAALVGGAASTQLEKRALNPQFTSLLYGLGAGAGALGLNALAVDKFDESLKSSRRSKEDRLLTKRLIGGSKYPVHHSKHMDSAMIVLDPSSDDIASINEALKVKLPEEGRSIVANPKASIPSILAHEIGHGEFHDGAVGKFLHSNSDSLKTTGAVLGAGLGLIGGSGSAGRHSRALNVASVAVPITAKVIGDMPEVVASIKALRQMEAEGASPEQMSRAKKQLALAYGTYASMLPMYAATGLLGQSIGHGVKSAGATKTALLERLVRLGATDVPKTPRLLMKQRSPQELASLQQGVSNWWGKKVSDPIMGVANKGLSKLPAGKVRNLATSGAKLVAQDPVGAIAANAVPIPGASLAYFGAKRGLERAIDRIAPLASSATPSV